VKDFDISMRVQLCTIHKQRLEAIKITNKRIKGFAVNPQAFLAIWATAQKCGECVWETIIK